MKNVSSILQAHAQGSAWQHQDSSKLAEMASNSVTLPTIALADDKGQSAIELLETVPRKPLDPVVAEMLQAFEFMQKNEDALDQKVAAFIRSSRQFRSNLIRMTRLGMWYMEDGGTRLVQCCVVRLYMKKVPTRSSPCILREFAIPVGDPAITPVWVRKDKG